MASGQAAQLLLDHQPRPGRRQHRLDAATSTAAATPSSRTSCRGSASRSSSSRSDDPTPSQKAIDGKTRALYFETVGNPALEMPDLEAVAKVAHAHGIPLIVDNTVLDALPVPAARPRRRHRRALGDQVDRRPRHVDRRGHRRRRQVRLGQAASSRSSPRPTPATTACVLGAFGASRPATSPSSSVRASGCATSAPACRPFNSFLFLQGLETLPLRMERHCENAMARGAVARAAPEGRVGELSPAWRATRRTSCARSTCASGRLARWSSSASRGACEAGTKFIDNVKLFSHSGQRRRRQEPGHPPGDAPPTSSSRRGAAGDGRNARPGARLASASSTSTTSSPTSTRRSPRANTMPARASRVPPALAASATSTELNAGRGLAGAAHGRLRDVRHAGRGWRQRYPRLPRTHGQRPCRQPLRRRQLARWPAKAGGSR